MDSDYSSYGDHTSADSSVVTYWAETYYEAHYEGRHRFDPEFTWSAM